MLINFHIPSINWPLLVISHYHLGNFCPFLLPSVVLDISMNVYVLMLQHDVKALIDNLPIPFTIDHISNLISLEGMLISPLYDSGLFLFSDILFDILESLGHKNKHYTKIKQ